MKLSAGIDGLKLPLETKADNCQYLYPGQTLVTREAKKLKTILGSCVAVCLWDKRTKLGGMTHFLLSHWSGEAQGNDRYGDVAIESLLRNMLANGASITAIQARVYGGAGVLQTAQDSLRQSLGARNVLVAREILRKNRIPIIDEQTGGENGLKIVFDTADGSAMVTRIKASK